MARQYSPGAVAVALPPSGRIQSRSDSAKAGYVTATGQLLDVFRGVGRELQALGLVYPGAGNMSVWTPEAVIITAEGARLHDLGPDDLSPIRRSTIAPARHPAQDAPIHRAVYVVSGARAVMHTHPPHAAALSTIRETLTPEDHESRFVLGLVPVIRSRRSMIDNIAEALTVNVAVMVAGHGAYVRGESLHDCLRLSATLEASARLVWLRASLRPNES